MKKSVIVVILALVVILLLSPGIVGRIAEQTVDENVNRAADQSDTLMVTSSGFERGWFSSEGEHRIELSEGGIRDTLTAAAGLPDDTDLPVLIVKTHIDHGLIPVTSMGRDEGSLAPGLGSAVSTLSIEMQDGGSVDVPGTIFSRVALDGDLESRYVLEAGTADVDSNAVTWQAVSIELVADATGASYSIDGEALGVEAVDGADRLTLGPMEFAGEFAPSAYGFMTGNMTMSMESVVVDTNGNKVANVLGLSGSGSTEIDDDRAIGDLAIHFDTFTVPNYGDVALTTAVSSNLDAAALGQLARTADRLSAGTDPMDAQAAMLEDLQAMVAAGFKIDVSQLDITVPMGGVRTVIHLSAPPVDAASFEWTSLLLNLKASMDVRVSSELVEFATSMDPKAGMMLAGGYLRRDGEDYVMEARMEKGLLTINGAPMPLPIGSF